MASPTGSLPDGASTTLVLNLLLGGHLARKPNYGYEKRKKEIDRKAKKDAKREERLQRKREEATNESESAPPAPEESPQSE